MSTELGSREQYLDEHDKGNFQGYALEKRVCPPHPFHASCWEKKWRWHVSWSSHLMSWERNHMSRTAGQRGRRSQGRGRSPDTIPSLTTVIAEAVFLRPSPSPKKYTTSQGRPKDGIRQVQKEPSRVPDTEQVSSVHVGPESWEPPAEECSYSDGLDPTIFIYFQQSVSATKPTALSGTRVEWEQSWSCRCKPIPGIHVEADTQSSALPTMLPQTHLCHFQ